MLIDDTQIRFKVIYTTFVSEKYISGYLSIYPHLIENIPQKTKGNLVCSSGVNMSCKFTVFNNDKKYIGRIELYSKSSGFSRYSLLPHHS